MSTYTRKLTVTSIKAIKTFTNKNGNESTIYEVFAVGEDGDPIDKTLRSFDALPEGELIEVEVSRYEHEKYGESFTLKPVGGSKGSPSPGARLGPKVDELRDKFEQLREDVADIRRRIDRLESGASATGANSAGEPVPDIPF